MYTHVERVSYMWQNKETQKHTYICAYIHTYIQTKNTYLKFCSARDRLQICMYVYMYVYVYVCIYVCMYAG